MPLKYIKWTLNRELENF